MSKKTREALTFCWHLESHQRKEQNPEPHEVTDRNTLKLYIIINFEG
jgi:hypothetical protein